MVVGLRPGSKTADTVKADGLEVGEVYEVINSSDMVLLLISDGAQAKEYPKVFKAMRPGTFLGLSPKLKGSIGVGSNHSNFSDQSSVRIQEILLEFIRNLKNQGCLTFSTIFGEISISSHRNLNKFDENQSNTITKFCNVFPKNAKKS